MKNKFFYVYLVAATVALILFLYQLLTRNSTEINIWNLGGDALMAVILFYMSYKTYHEKKDKELM